MARSWIGFPRREGAAPKQAHTAIPRGAYERELGKEGFFGPVTQMYHAHPPTGWSAWEGELRPRAFDLNLINHESSSPWEADAVLGNAALALRLWRIDGKMDFLARNADGDELIFVHEGEGELFCDWGHLPLRDGDYVVLPRGAMWRIEPRGAMVALLLEATGDSFRLPEKGMVGRHAVFDPGVLETPALDAAFEAQKGERETRVVLKRGDRLSTITYPFNPLDAIGWQGDLAPVKLNWRDIRPLMSHRAHLPPSAHTTFVAGRFVVCTFTPRPAESDPDALKLPFFHNNDDFDEVIFYHRGKFMSRDNIRPGMITFHPCGFTHGPHPKAFALAAQAPGGHMLDEVAVMIDARDALTIAELPAGVEQPGYVDSWKPKRRAREAMKLATLKEGGRDGTLVVVSRDLARATRAGKVAPTLQAALDDWANCGPRLAAMASMLERGAARDAFTFDPAACAAPLPRAYQFADGSAYLWHVELVRKARKAEMPPSYYDDPLMYQGLSDGFLGPADDVALPDEADGIDFEAEVGVIVDDVPMGVSAEAALGRVRLVVILNDVSLRNLIPAELGKGFGFFHAKPASSFAPVAVTPDELGPAWREGKLHRPLVSTLNGREFGRPDAGVDMNFGFGRLIAHAARTRRLAAGTIVGSGTVSNRDPSTGSSCLAELRTLETLRDGKPSTPFMKFGDRVRIEMLDEAGRSIFGAIDQRIVRYTPPP